METKMSLQGIERTEWLHLRKTGLGGSDAGAVCGLNPYSSPLQVFYDKTSEEVQDKDSESMRQGRDLEGVCGTAVHGRNRKEGATVKLYVPFGRISVYACGRGSSCGRRRRRPGV